MILLLSRWGDNIKKNIEIIIVAVVLCLVFTKAMFTSYKEEVTSIMDGNIYLLQYGSYINSLVMEENIKELDNYITYVDDDKYYVFVGASTSYENAYLLSKILEGDGIYTYIKNDYISDSKLIEKINIIDKEIVKDNHVILDANKEILNLLKENYF